MIIKRPIFNKLYGEIKEPEISVLLGARQVGKTTLLKQLESQAKKEGLTTRYFDLESSFDLEQLSGSDKEIVKVLSGSGDVIFIDEFHYLKNASKIFKEIYDSKKNIKIYASGSSSIEMHKHLKESLAGRFRRTIIFPLSLDELSQIRNFKEEDLFKWGGLPGLLHRNTEDDKMDLLSNIVSTYITKDIKALIKEENVRAFNSMLYSLAQNQGSLTVAASLAKECKISESVTARYLEIMSQTYVCHVVSSYSTNLANELKKTKKCYLFDLGIRNALLKDYRPMAERNDKGAIFETAVLLHLIPLLKPNMELRFWRTKKGAEVDLVLLINRQPIPIEVKSDLKSPEIPSGIKSFLGAYPKVKKAFVVCYDLKTTMEFNGAMIEFLPLNQLNEIFSIA